MRNIFHYIISVLILTLVAEPRPYDWRDYYGALPSDAIGFDGIYIAQVLYKDGLLPGSLYPYKKQAVIECCGGKWNRTEQIKVLCDTDNTFFWEETTTNDLQGSYLTDLVVGGYEEKSELYIGKIFHEGEWQISKVFPPLSKWRGFRGWWINGSLYGSEVFHILKYRNKTNCIQLYN